MKYRVVIVERGFDDRRDVLGEYDSLSEAEDHKEQSEEDDCCDYYYVVEEVL